MSKVSYPCLKCNKNVLSDAIECSLCLAWSHRTCAKLSKKELQLLSRNEHYWYCYECSIIFPYQMIDDDEFVYIHSNLDSTNDFLCLLNHCKSIQADQDEKLDNDNCLYDSKI